MNRIAVGLSLLILGLISTTEAMVVQSVAYQSFPATGATSPAHYAFVIDSDCGAEKTCRNNPIDNTDPLGLAQDVVSLSMDLESGNITAGLSSDIPSTFKTYDERQPYYV